MAQLGLPSTDPLLPLRNAELGGKNPIKSMFSGLGWCVPMHCARAGGGQVYLKAGTAETPIAFRTVIGAI